MRLVIGLCLAALLAAGCGEDKKPGLESPPASDQGKPLQPPAGKNRDKPGFN